MPDSSQCARQHRQHLDTLCLDVYRTLNHEARMEVDKHMPRFSPRTHLLMKSASMSPKSPSHHFPKVFTAQFEPNRHHSKLLSLCLLKSPGRLESHVLSRVRRLILC
jgi:hypothetical protein